MQRHHRIRLLAVAAVLVIAGSVWVAGDRQRSAAEASSRDRVEVAAPNAEGGEAAETALFSGEDG
jgi:hypothetical protein